MSPFAVGSLVTLLVVDCTMRKTLTGVVGRVDLPDTCHSIAALAPDESHAANSGAQREEAECY